MWNERCFVDDYDKKPAGHDPDFDPFAVPNLLGKKSVKLPWTPERQGSNANPNPNPNPR